MKIRIMGAGVMGRGIAQWAATSGHEVELADVRLSVVTEAIDFVRKMLDRSVQKRRLSRAQADRVAERISAVDSPTAKGGDVELVVEAVKEDLAVKAALFTDLEKELPAM